MPIATNSTNVHRPTLGRMISQSTIQLMMIIGVLICFLAFLNLIHKNANATKGYELRQLKNDRTVLQQEMQEMKANISQAQSLSELENDRIIHTMINVRRPLYIQGDSTLAEKQDK